MLGDVLKGLAAPDYTVASDLKTRVDDDSDFATDSALVTNPLRSPAKISAYVVDI